MEGIERFEVMSPSLNGYAYIHDFKTDNVLNTYDSCDLLNQQAERIKELEKENQQLKQQLEEAVLEAVRWEEHFNQAKLSYECLKEELAEKEKEQNQKAIEQLEKVKTQCEFDISFACDEQEQRLYDFIDQQINELKGKNNGI